MEQKVLNEEQMREYIENEVRMALLAEGIDENVDEGLLDILKNVFGGRGISMEGIIGAILGHIAITPILTKLLNVIGIPADGPLGQFILKRVGEVGGYTIGDWIDKKWDPIGVDNAANSVAKYLPGLGGNTSPTGGGGYQGGGVGGGGR